MGKNLDLGKVKIQMLGKVSNKEVKKKDKNCMIW